MRLRILQAAVVPIAFLFVLTACQTAQEVPTDLPLGATASQHGLAVEPFLADIARNVAGERMEIDTLIPEGLDPHSFEPTPQDIAKISESRVIIINGGGLEAWLDDFLANRSADQLVIVASAGLTPRTPQADEVAEPRGNSGGRADDHNEAGDPHYWLDPVLVIKYVENIRDGLIQVDPEGEAVYSQNADAYIRKLRDLDVWIQDQVKAISLEDRLLVTNHESFGYFADRYGFKIVGSVIPSVSTNASPSAQQMAWLVGRIKDTGAKAVFLETGSNADLARQIAQETGVVIITDLYTHSSSAPGGAAPNYIEMLRHNVQVIVNALR